MKSISTDFKEYLEPTYFLNFETEEVQHYVTSCLAGIHDQKEQIVKLYLTIRDSIEYSMYDLHLSPEYLKASYVLQASKGFCIQKSILFAACARVIGIPSRLGFADVQNHLASEKIIERLKTDLFIFHGYAELYVNDKWVKATPVFNKLLCEKFDVTPLEFDGTEDSIFHEFDRVGHKNMEYIKFYDTYSDLPHELMISTIKNAYPHLFDEENLIFN